MINVSGILQHRHESETLGEASIVIKKIISAEVPVPHLNKWDIFSKLINLQTEQTFTP